MKKHMEQETLDTFNRIECNAQIMLERDMEEPPEHVKALLKKTKCISPKDYAAKQEIDKQ